MADARSVIEILRACRASGSTTTRYSRRKPPTLATSATPSTEESQYRSDQSWKVRSAARSLSPLSSTSAYSYTHPTPVASGPIEGLAPDGKLPWSFESCSRTRVRAQ